MTVKGFQCKIGQTKIMGIKVEVEILTSLDGGKNWLINHISSGGRCGIGSDSDDEYFDQVASDEKAELTTTLAGMGFSETEIKKSFDKAQESAEEVLAVEQCADLEVL